MIAKHRDILDASDRQQPWAENSMVLLDQDGFLGSKESARCYDVAFEGDCGRGAEPAKIANQAILKMMGKL
jgi:hypothetical protein